MIENATDLLRSFLILHEEACNLIREKPRTAAGIVSRAVGIMDEEFILKAYKISPKYCASLPVDYIKSTIAFVPVLKKMGYISNGLTEKDVFFSEIIDSVHDGPSHYESPAEIISA
jgi:NitT/TauT family transport system substrate-binding protein